LSGGGPAWGRLYRWELLTFSLETLALATILAGAAQVRYRGRERICHQGRGMSNFAQYFAFSRKISDVILNSFREQVSYGLIPGISVKFAENCIGSPSR
jgi:hypothetical protein